MPKEDKTKMEENAEMKLDDYVNMPQNDKQQIEQIVREYDSDPAKGLAHGIQKDALQNAFGARVIQDEVKACRGKWRCFFEIVAIKGQEAFVFWDEGTTGLTGDILSVEDIEKRSADELLGKGNANQRLARFLTRFESGGNIGPGSFGRGKLIFQGASKNHSIVVDSLRSDDGQYIAFDRLIKGTQLKQQRIPFVGERAEKFLSQITGGRLRPLIECGTRIIILDVKDEIIEAFKKSFTKEAEEDGYSESFSRMIEETWWEIIGYGAKIILRLGGKEKQVEITEPLKTLLKAHDNEGKYHVYAKDNINVEVDGVMYKIKHLKYIVAPHPIDDELREIWVQRKRMKIGSISKGIKPHHKIEKNFTGYIILDSNLESKFEEKESPTHYGFVIKGRGGGAIAEVRNVARAHLEKFHQQLGLRVESGEAKAQKEMLDMLKELNEQADSLGLQTEYASGSPQKDVEIMIDSFVLPNIGSMRVEIGDTIGPIIYKVVNNTNKQKSIKIEITGEQKESRSVLLLEKDLDLKGKENTLIEVQFDINKDQYVPGEGLLIRAKVYGRSTPPEQIHQVSRKIWIGIDPQFKPQECVDVYSCLPVFPRSASRRVELNEYIRNIQFRLSSNVSIPLKINLDMVVRRAKSSSHNVIELIKLLGERGLELPPLAEKTFSVPELQISEDIYGGIYEEAALPEERKCEIYFSVRASDNYPDLKKIIGEHLGPKKAIPFFCGIDPSGMSIFKSVGDSDAPENGKRSWVDGDKASGYSFILNVGHEAYKLLADEIGGDSRKYYIKEQMLFQAYLIAAQEGVFKGPAEQFNDQFSDENLDPIEAVKIIDEIVGSALNQVV